MGAVSKLKGGGSREAEAGPAHGKKTGGMEGKKRGANQRPTSEVRAIARKVRS